MKVTFHSPKIIEALESSAIPIGEELKGNYLMIISALLIDIKRNGTSVRKSPLKPDEAGEWKFRPPFGETNDGGQTLRITLRKSPAWEAHYYYEKLSSCSPKELLKLYQASIPPMQQNQLLSETWTNSIECCFRHDVSSLTFLTHNQREMMWTLFDGVLIEASLMNWPEIETLGLLSYTKLVKSLPTNPPYMPKQINRYSKLFTPVK